MADRTPRLPSVGLLRRLTLLSLLLTAAVWVVQYSALLCDPPPPALERVAVSSPSLPSFPSLSRQSPSAVARWLRASLSSHAVSPTHTACLLPANQSDPGFTTLLALGDLHLSVNRPDGELDTPSLLQPLPQGMSGVDAVVGNLASAVAGSEELAALRTLRSLGLRLVSLANVPLHEAGDPARQSTLRALEAAGIRWLGVRVKHHEVVVIQGEKVGFLAFCAVYGRCVESSGLPYAPLKYTPKAATSAVSRLREHGITVIIVMVAWGHGTGLFPDETCLTVARHLATLQVTAVLGYHPTAVQGHAYFGDTLVVFSMGKVLSSQEVAPFCWGQTEAGSVYSDTVGRCAQVHHNIRESLRVREQQTRLYRISITRPGRAIAHFLSLPLLSTGSVYSPGLDSPADWTLACGDSDLHCLSCQPL